MIDPSTKIRKQVLINPISKCGECTSFDLTHYHKYMNLHYKRPNVGIDLGRKADDFEMAVKKPMHFRRWVFFCFVLVLNRQWTTILGEFQIEKGILK